VMTSPFASAQMDSCYSNATRGYHSNVLTFLAHSESKLPVNGTEFLLQHSAFYTRPCLTHILPIPVRGLPDGAMYDAKSVWTLCELHSSAVTVL
jgi:hypothetical protein